MDKYEQFKKWASDMGDEFMDLFDAFEEEVLGTPPKKSSQSASSNEEPVNESPKGETEFEKMSRCKEQMERAKVFVKSHSDFIDMIQDSCIAHQNGEGYDLDVLKSDPVWNELNSLREFLGIYYYLLQPFEFVPMPVPETYGKDVIKVSFVKKDHFYNRYRDDIDTLKKLY